VIFLVFESSVYSIREYYNGTPVMPGGRRVICVVGDDIRRVGHNGGTSGGDGSSDSGGQW
jgi:hypothetical protein